MEIDKMKNLAMAVCNRTMRFRDNHSIQKFVYELTENRMSSDAINIKLLQLFSSASMPVPIFETEEELRKFRLVVCWCATQHFKKKA
jgi:hypothetical protein